MQCRPPLPLYIDLAHTTMTISIEDDLRDWSRHVLEVPSLHLKGLPPCPYAKKAWLDNKVEVIEVATDDVVGYAIKNAYKVLSENKELIVTASYELPDALALQKSIDAINMLGAKQDLYFMCFHPDYGAEDADLDFLYETDWQSSIEQDYCMVFVQRLSNVDDKSRVLEKQGYYEAFPKDEYDLLVSNRRKLREQYHNGDETSCND